MVGHPYRFLFMFTYLVINVGRQLIILCFLSHFYEIFICCSIKLCTLFIYEYPLFHIWDYKWQLIMSYFLLFSVFPCFIWMWCHNIQALSLNSTAYIIDKLCLEEHTWHIQSSDIRRHFITIITIIIMHSRDMNICSTKLKS